MTSAVEHKYCEIETIMAARTDSISSEEFLSDVTSEHECNFYDSDVGETSVASVDVGPRPYHFEPCRIHRNVERERINNHEEQTESETNCLGTGNCFSFHFVHIL